MIAGVTHGNPAQRMVALTFDDGPSGRTAAILRVLARHHAHATFFVVGRATRGMEPVLRHVAATGNELADHTYSHADLLALHARARRAQLQWTRGLVWRATGIQARFFRPPYGATGPAVNRLGRSLGLIPVLWSVDSRDWQQPGTKAIVQRVLAHVRPGAIVLMHDGGGDRRETLRALPSILRALQRRHFEVVTLSRMLATRRLPARSGPGRSRAATRARRRLPEHGPERREDASDQRPSRHSAVVARIVRVRAVVAHDEDIAAWHHDRAEVDGIDRRVVDVGLPLDVPVDREHAVLDRHAVSGQTDDALDGERSAVRRAEHDEVAAPRRSEAIGQLLDEHVVSGPQRRRHALGRDRKRLRDVRADRQRE